MEKFCDVCKNSVTVKTPNCTDSADGATDGRIHAVPESMMVVGLSVELRCDIATPQLKERLVSMMSPYETNRRYLICYPCLLKAMGVKAEIPLQGEHA